MRNKRKEHRKKILTSLFILYALISYYCYQLQDNYLHGMILFKNTLVWLNMSSWLIVGVIIYFCIRDGGYSEKQTFKENFKIGIIAEGLCYMVALTLSVMWLPVCLVFALKINSINYEKTLYTDIYKIENIDVIEKNGVRMITPDYTCVTLRNMETNKEVKFYLSPKANIMHGISQVKLSYYKGNLGWYILKSTQ